MNNEKDTVLIKYGSSCLADADGIDHARLDHYAEQLAEVHDQYNLVVVSSGSIAVGRTMWRQSRGYQSEPSEQSLATLGSAQAVSAWQNALMGHGLLSGQIEVTHHEVRDDHEGKMLRRVLTENIEHGIVSLINENDALSDEEIIKLHTGGDNDGLASLIAQTLGANRLLLLTADAEGLMNDDGEVVGMVGHRKSSIKDALGWTDDKPGELGRGGMEAKVYAAFGAAQSGVRSHIARAGRPIDAIINREHGTYFAPPH